MNDFTWFLTIFFAVYLGVFLAITTAVLFFDTSNRKNANHLDTSTAEGMVGALTLAAEFSTETNNAATGDVHVPVGDFPPPYTAD